MELTSRQRKAARKIYRAKGGPVWWRVGEGKTRIAYKFFAMVAKQVAIKCPRFLVVCRREAFEDWTDEVKKLGLNWKVRPIESEEDIFCVPVTQPTVYLLSHGKLARMLPELCDISGVLISAVYDEGWLYKNPQTKHSKAANHLSSKIGYTAILSGSMMTQRDHTDIYGQLFAVNKHSVLASTLTSFRSRFMFKYRIRPNDENSPTRFATRRGAGKRIARLIRPVASVYFPTKNRRRVKSSVRRIPASRDQLRAFEELREYFELELKGKPRMLLKNAPSVMIKCQQISDGWVKHTDGSVHRFKSAKQEYLIAQLRDLIDAGESVVVWVAFRRTAKYLLQALQKAFPRVGCYKMIGGEKFDKKGWDKNGRIAVCTVGSGSSINHFRNCAYAIYYSHDCRWKHMQQSQGRTDRKDSRHDTCYYYFMQTEGSMDSRIYSIVHQSKNAEKDMIADAVGSWLTNKT